jgi:hypothetical protein
MPNFSDISWPSGKSNPGGLKQYVYYAPIEDFATIPKPVSNPGTLAARATITENYVFKTGKKWLKLYCTLETGEVKHKQVGPRDSKSFENTGEISIPGSEADVIGLGGEAANSSFIFLFPERNGKVRVIGSADFPATIEENEGSSGKANADGRSTKIVVKDAADTPAPIYTGEITLTAAP